MGLKVEEEAPLGAAAGAAAFTVVRAGAWGSRALLAPSSLQLTALQMSRRRAIAACPASPALTETIREAGAVRGTPALTGAGLLKR